ncbi:MAG: AAA family ATPase, partial [Deltaproteobacteria bacterium]|nr:AAA family ATPase [Deltaproteobacteria bacterium]
HPNLVTLFELLCADDDWLLTMEVVDGCDFMRWVRPTGEDDDEPSPGDDDATATLSLRPGSRGAVPAGGGSPPSRPRLLREERLRAALPQLASAVAALHAGGRLHRDIKPSNVLVSRSGRVVLCDFGLVAEVDDDRLHRPSPSQRVVGTAAYMSPEQARNRALGEASDWYSVGVMLYEALTGHLPFEGTRDELLVRKLLAEPLPVAVLEPDAPADLAELAQELLRIEPERRPSAASVLVRLGVADDHARRHVPRTRAGATTLFVGREAHLAALHDAFAASLAGKALTVLVHGASGMGKSALAARFLSEVRRTRDVVILAGRCHERESVPYKALDSLVDSLSSYLATLPADVVEPMLPADVAALARLFPTLRRVDAVAQRIVSTEVPDPHELRRRAFVAFRQLLRNIADEAPTIVFIDDLQWGDADSAALLVEALRSPGAPAFLLLACYRTEDAATSAFLRAFSAATGSRSEREGELRQLDVAPLEREDRETLAAALLATSAFDDAHSIAAESGGSPFFLEELVRYVTASRTDPTRASAASPTSLDEVLRARMAALPEAARTLLSVFAVSGRPLTLSAARRAGGLEPGVARAGLLALEHGRFVRAGADEAERIETYHDRVRATALGLIAPDALREVHLGLAETLEIEEPGAAEAIAEHFEAAGELDRASEHAQRAAEQAASALAFDRAVRLYRHALEMRSVGDPSRRALLVELGHALVNAGRGAEAATAYLSACEHADGEEALDLRRRAAEQLLLSGHVTQGIGVLREVLAEVGMEIPATPRRALASLLVERGRLRLRGQTFVERSEARIPAAELERLDILWSAAAGLTLVDVVRGHDFLARYIRLALDVGEPYRVARGLALETVRLASSGSGTKKRTEQLRAYAEELAARTGNPHAIALAATTSGVAACMQGRWRDTGELCARAEELLRARCTGVAWELAAAQFFGVVSLVQLGELRAMDARISVLLPEAEERGDVLASTNLRIWRNIVLLAKDQPDEARRELRETELLWPAGEFHLAHYYRLYALCQTDLYCGDDEAAWERASTSWKTLTRSLLLRIQNLRIEAHFLHARCALAAASRGHAGGQSLVAVAADDARAVEREKVPWAVAIARTIGAQVAIAQRRPEEGAKLLADAAERFEGADMALHAALLRLVHGRLVGASAGAEEVAQASRWLATQDVERPERLARMLVPIVALER